MLKDLDERKPEQAMSGPANQVVQTHENKKSTLLLVVIALVVLNVLGWFVWQIYSENQTLKASQNQPQPQVSGAKKPVTEKTSEPVVLNNDTSNDDTMSTVQKTVQQPAQTVVEQEVPVESKPEVKSSSHTEQTSQEVVTASKAVAKPVANVNESKAQASPEVKTPPVEQVKPTMTVARKQLSPQQLIERKTEQAEKAIANNELAKAEQLYEDVLLIDQDQHEIRKQLAALWFGRKAYQAALNLLQQGSALDYNNSDFRLMKARIYLTTGQAMNALNELLVLKDVNNVEYQAMIASTAQQLEQYPVSISAYQRLTSLQPNDGRWWLGLAIAHDASSAFELAKNAYKNAISLAGISDSSMAFARQRLQELGE